MSGENFGETWAEEYTDERTDRATNDFMNELWEKHPEIALELEAARDGEKTTEETGWLVESQVTDVRRLSNHRVNSKIIRPGSSLDRVTDTFKESWSPGWTQEEQETASREIVQNLYRPVAQILQEAGIQYDQTPDPGETHQLMDTEQRIAHNWNLNLEDTGKFLNWWDKDQIAFTVDRLEQYTQDVLKMVSGERPDYFEELIQEKLGGGDWREITTLKNAGFAFSAFQEMEGKWSREQIKQTAEDFSEELRERSSGQVLERLQNPASVYHEEDRHMNWYLKDRTNQATIMIKEGATGSGEKVFMRGIENLRLAISEGEKFLESGEIPPDRDDGTMMNASALELLAYARSTDTTPDEQAQHVREAFQERETLELLDSLTQRHPDLGRTMKYALSGQVNTASAAWMTGPQSEIVYDSEDEREYHYELRAESASYKVLDNFVETAHEMEPEEAEKMAQANMRALYAPAYLSIRKSGMDYHEILEQEQEGMPDTWQRLALQCKNQMEGGARALMERDPEKLMDVMDGANQLGWDIEQAKPQNGALKFEDRAKEQLGEGTDWREITKPENRDSAWNALAATRGQWSLGYIQETIADYLRDANQEIRAEIASLQDAGREERLIQWMKAAEELTRLGIMQQDRAAFDLGTDNADAVRQELQASRNKNQG